MADFPSSKRTAVTTVPRQTSYQSTAASGSHLNIIAKSNEMTPIDAIIVTRCKSHSCTCGAAYFPKAASPSMDPWRSPQWVCDAHLADQSAYFQRNCWPATTRSRLPAPIQTETRTVPSDYGPGLNNRKRIKNVREEATETNEHQSVDG